MNFKKSNGFTRWIHTISKKNETEFSQDEVILHRFANDFIEDIQYDDKWPARGKNINEFLNHLCGTHRASRECVGAFITLWIGYRYYKKQNDCLLDQKWLLVEKILQVIGQENNYGLYPYEDTWFGWIYYNGTLEHEYDYDDNNYFPDSTGSTGQIFQEYQSIEQINDLKKSLDHANIDINLFKKYFETKTTLAIPPITQQITLSTRFDVLKRDNYKCQICGRTAQDNTKLEVDHKIPKSKGGSNEVSNLWTLCFDCNRGKSNKQI